MHESNHVVAQSELHNSRLVLTIRCWHGKRLWLIYALQPVSIHMLLC